MRLFFNAQITDEMLDLAEKYLRAVIRNATSTHYRENKKFAKKGITIEPLTENNEQPDRSIDIFDQALSQYINCKNINFQISDPDIFDAINSLTEKQRIVLIENIFLQIPLNKVAAELGISIRMVSKHKKAALKNIRRSLENVSE